MIWILTARPGGWRDISKYGIPDKGVSPGELFDKTKAEKWNHDAQKVYGFVTSVIRAKLFSPKINEIKIALLDGTVDGFAEESSCSKAKSAWTAHSISEWEKVLAEQNIKVTKIPISNLDRKYELVINPFGEDYPEEDNNIDPPASFKKILDYIARGGFFVCAGGLPFWTAWLTKSTRKQPTEDRRAELAEVRLKVVYNKGKRELRELTLLNTGLYARFFGAQVTNDSPFLAKLRESDIFHAESPRLNLGNVSIFRPTVNSNYFPIIHLLEASRIDETPVYPMVAIPYNAGCLISFGMNLDAKLPNELETIVKCIKKFISLEKEKAKSFKIAL